MSNYTKATNFAAKDALAPGNAGKVVKGTELDTNSTTLQLPLLVKQMAY